MREKFLYRPICELCGSDRKTVLLSKEFTDSFVWNFLDEYYGGRIDKSELMGGKYEVVKCSECGFVWQTHILNDELMEKLYNIWISPEQSLKKKKCSDISLFSGYAREVEGIIFLLSKKPFEIDILDFGAGWGYWCQMAKSFGCNVKGFDTSKERIEFARKNGIDVIENFVEISNYKFDFINAEQVFEHIPNPLQTLRFLTRSLKNGGIIRISVPNGRGVERDLTELGRNAINNLIDPLEHINCFTHQTLKKLGESAGLKLARQPFLLGHRFVLTSYFKGVLSKYYKQYFGTSLYFKRKG